MQPLHDTAGAGLSLLDTILHQRVDASGVVAKTVTRLCYAARLDALANSADIADLHAAHLAEADADVTGILIIQQRSCLCLIEAAPETVTGLMRILAAETERPSPRIVTARVIAHTEDCPARCCPPWTAHTLALPGEAAVDVDAEAPAALATQLYRTLQQIGTQLREGEGKAEALQATFGSYLPSDDRVQAIGSSDKFTSVHEWLDLFDAALEYDQAQDEVLPLPPRPVY